MARGSHSRSRSPGPWRGRDRDVGAMACVGPPPSRMRGHGSSRSSRAAWGDQQHEKLEHHSRGGKVGASDKDVYCDSSRTVGGSGGIHAHKQRGGSCSSWQSHAGGGGGGRMLRATADDGRGGGDGASASARKSPAHEGRGARLRSGSSSSRRTNHRDSRAAAGGAPAAPLYHGFFNSGTAYDRRSSGAWGQQRDTRAHAASENVYGAAGSSGSGAATAPPPYNDVGAGPRSSGWLGDCSQKEEEKASAYSYYQGGGCNNVEAQQQKFGALSSSTRMSRAPRNVPFDGGAEPAAEPGHGPEQPIRGGGGAAAAAGNGGINKRQPTEDDEERLLQGPLLNFKQFVFMKPDDCTQKELSRAYEAYVERYKRYHAEQFFEKYGGHAFMRELYHPNAIRRQHELRKTRAKMLAQAFLQKYQQDFFSGLALEAESGEICRSYLETEEDSPLLLKQWPSSFTISRGSQPDEVGDAEVVEVEDDMSEEAAGEKRDDILDEQQKEKGEDNEEEMQKSGDGRRRRGTATGAAARRRSSATATASGEDDDEAAAGDSGDEQGQAPADSRSKRWPPYVLLPSAEDCLVIHAVDPSISSLDIYDELSSKGVVEVSMVPEGNNPTEQRTAYVFFSSNEAKQNYKQRCPDTILKLTKPVVTVGADGEEQETLKVLSLSLREPPTPSSCEAFVTPPAACIPSRLQKDLDTSAALILALDRQQGIFEDENTEGLQHHPLLSTFPESWSTAKRLDMQITYLRQVHALCYYSGELCRDLVDLNMRCGKAYLRPRLPSAAKQAMYVQLQQQSNSSVWEGGEETTSSEEEEDEDRDRKGRSKGGRGRRRSSATPTSGNGPEEEEQQEGEMEDDNGGGEAAKTEKSKEHLCVAHPQRRWMRQLDRKLLLLLKKIEKMHEDLPAALEEDTPIISLKWNAFCHEKVFEDDEHKHRCRLCNKPFKAPHFVFKHLRKKHEEELNFIIERYASIVMKEAYMKDPAKPLVLAAGATGGESNSPHRGREEDVPPNSAASSLHAARYGWGFAHPSAASPATGAAPGATPPAAGWSSSLPPGAPPPAAPPSIPGTGPPPPYGVVFVPDRNVHVAGTHPMYAAGGPSGGVLTHPVAPTSSQYYPFGGAFVPHHVVYGGAVTNFGVPGAVITPRRRDWDAPEPVAAVLAPAGGAVRQVNGSRRLASYADL